MDEAGTAKGSRLYWRLALLLPVLGAGLGFLFEGYGILLAAGFVFVAIPYVVFAAVMWWWTRRLESPRQFLLAAASAPFVLAVITFVTLMPIVWFRMREPSLAAMGPLVWMLPWVLLIGYLYVGAAALGYVIGLKWWR